MPIFTWRDYKFFFSPSLTQPWIRCWSTVLLSSGLKRSLFFRKKTASSSLVECSPVILTLSFYRYHIFFTSLSPFLPPEPRAHKPLLWVCMFVCIVCFILGGQLTGILLVFPSFFFLVAAQVSGARSQRDCTFMTTGLPNTDRRA